MSAPPTDAELDATLAHVATHVADIQGWVTDHAGMALYRLARLSAKTPTVVELGSWKGRSTSWLAHAIRDRGEGHVFAVDTWGGTRGEETHAQLLEGLGPDELYGEFLGNLARQSLTEQVTPLRMSTIAAARAWSGAPIGLLFIDADHDYLAVRQDFEYWSPFVEIGGYIVFDDVPSWPGPSRLIQELPRWYRQAGWSNNNWIVRKLADE